MVYLNYSESCYNGRCQTWQTFQIKRSINVKLICLSQGSWFNQTQYKRWTLPPDLKSKASKEIS